MAMVGSLGLCGCDKKEDEKGPAGSGEMEKKMVFEVKSVPEALNAPGEANATAEADLSLYADGRKISGTVSQPDATANEYVTWEIASTSDGASVDEKGHVTVNSKFIYGDINGKDIIFKARYFKDGAEKEVTTFSLHVNEPLNNKEQVNAEPVQEKQIYEMHKDIDEAAFLYVNKELSKLGTKEAAEFLVDVSGMALYREGAVYQVTYKLTDGTLKAEDKTEENGKLVLNVTGCTEVEVSPVFFFKFGKYKTELPKEAINVTMMDVYNGSNDYGVYGAVENLQGAVHFKGVLPGFVMVAPNGFYNINLTKGECGRSIVLLNGQALGCNVGIGGSGGRKGTTPYEYYMEDVKVTDGVIRVNLGEKDFDLAALEIRRSTTLRERKLHLYLAGDSTAAGYYPIETEEPENGRYQTGWGQMFGQFVTDEVAITNLGSGGTYAKSWYEIAFGGVLQNACPGDYFVIMEGINDQSYSNVDEMVTYLGMMIDQCREKDIIPVLCTAMQSAKFWKDDKGKELSEFECPLGSGKASFMVGIRKLAEEKQVFLVDVGDITSKQYGTLGRSYVAQNYHLYNAGTGVEEDTLHLSYAGAKNVAGIIATRLYELQESGNTDGRGQKITGIAFNPLCDEEIEYTDASGNKATYTTKRVSAVYKRYAMKQQ